MDPNTIRTWVELLALVAGFLWGAHRYTSRLEKRMDKQDAEAALRDEKLAAIIAENKKQYGGNSGGMREAINNIATVQAEIRGDVASQRDVMTRHLEQHAAQQG